MESPVRSESLTRTFGRVEALRGVTFDVPRGSVFALMGANGAGKTTAIKTLLNIIPATAGRSWVLGAVSPRLGPAEFARIGYVSENQELPEWMTIEQFLHYCGQFYPDWDAEDAAGLVRRLELPAGRRLSALSRGMKVKAALAASLPYRPELIVLDEPFSGLDGLVREQVIESILERLDHATVLVASHDLAEIENCATHVAYLREGRLLFTEEMESLTGRFREVEVTLPDPGPLALDPPAHWLNISQAGRVVRFVHSSFHAAALEEVRSRFAGIREIAARPMPLRSIFVALERAHNKEAAL